MLTRGYLFRGHFECRFALLQGYRNNGSTNPFRTTTRVVWYPFEAETEFFYTGTTFGKRRILALGANRDHQEGYEAHGVDAFLDWPVRHGDAVTLQGNFTRLDGGRTFCQLPREHVWLLEAAYFFGRWKVSPFLQFAGRDYRQSGRRDERSYQGGVAYWMNGHCSSLK